MGWELDERAVPERNVAPQPERGIALPLASASYRLRDQEKRALEKLSVARTGDESRALI
jgi:hypothetical protein